MKAMILAAGRGERMRPLTDSLPKPLLTVNGKPLIQYHIEALKAAGIKELIVNVAWLADKLIEFLGDGSRFGIPIKISHEKDNALETAGGIRKALPLLGSEPFIVVNGDIYTNYDFSTLSKIQDTEMHIVLVDNPAHNPAGDFYFASNQLQRTAREKLTFSGIGVYQAHIFSNIKPNTAAPLKPLFEKALSNNSASAEYFNGQWTDVGTPERLAILNQQLGIPV